jgi:hypothetical protein
MRDPLKHSLHTRTVGQSRTDQERRLAVAWLVPKGQVCSTQPDRAVGGTTAVRGASPFRPALPPQPTPRPRAGAVGHQT